MNDDCDLLKPRESESPSEFIDRLIRETKGNRTELFPISPKPFSLFGWLRRKPRAICGTPLLWMAHDRRSEAD